VPLQVELYPLRIVYVVDSASALNPSSAAPSQSSSMPLQVSTGGSQVPHVQEDEQVRVPVDEQAVAHGSAAPLQQEKPLSQTVSQSSSAPLHVSAAISQVPHVQEGEQVRVPVPPQEVGQEPVEPAQHSNPSSHVPLQSSSAPLHVSSGGSQEPHTHVSRQVRVPVLPQEVVQDPDRPAQQAMPVPSSQTPLQSSSRPLQVSSEGVQGDSQLPSPSVSAQPGWQRVVQTPSSHRASALSPELHTLPQLPQLTTSLWTSVQVPPQLIHPAGHPVSGSMSGSASPAPSSPGPSRAASSFPSPVQPRAQAAGPAMHRAQGSTTSRPFRRNITLTLIIPDFVGNSNCRRFVLRGP
jgi:hypothetical protein